MVETTFFFTPLYARSLKQCIELNKQVVKCMYFKILTISIALDLSFLPSDKVGCLHIYEYVCVSVNVCSMFVCVNVCWMFRV